MLWRAACANRDDVVDGTKQGKTVITLEHGAWKSTGSYRSSVKGEAGLTGRFHIVYTGRFVNQNQARGSFRISAQLYVNGRLQTHCDTGRVTWTAKRHS
jgi:hypothetical protein